MNGEENTNEIKFQAAVSRVATLADGGLRITMDLPETAILEAAQLMECKRSGIYLDITATISDNEETKTISRRKAKRRI